MKRLIKNGCVWLMAMVVSLLLTSCDEEGDGGDELPYASFSSTTDTEDPLIVYFENNSFGGEGFAWDFGDGAVSDVEDPTHVYSEEGTFEVELTVTNAAGDHVATESMTVEVPAPDISFTYSIQSATFIVEFINSTSGAKSYSWDFGDGFTSALENPVHAYTSGGTYTVTLTAVNEGGTTTESQEVLVIAYGANLVIAGDMSDETAWTLQQITNNHPEDIVHGFRDGAFWFQQAEGSTASGGTYQSNHTFYQEVAVEAGKTYQFSAYVSSTTGTESTWFEVFFGNEMPGENDYSSGGTQIFLKSYGTDEDCSTTSFEGSILDVIKGDGLTGCPIPSGSLLGEDGTFTLTEEALTVDGTIFLVFKVGTWDGTFREGITLDNVEIKEVL